MNLELIPAVDAAGIPGPPWLFQALLVFTFFLHLLFVNLTLGGTLLAAISSALGGGGRHGHRGALANRLMAVNTFGISLTITTGVAPLLFMQVIYHHFFYPATILIAGAWLGFLLLLLVGYYAAYLFKFRGAPARGQGGGIWLWISAVCFLLVAMVHVAVNLIHSQPGLWDGLAANPWAILGDPTYLLRLLHFVLAGLSISALVAVWWAVRKAGEGEDVELNAQVARFAWKWALACTALLVVDGFVLLLVLPRPVLVGLMAGGAATMVPLTLAILLAIGLLLMLARVTNPLDKPALVSGTLATMVLAVAVMTLTRHQVRDLYLEPLAERSVFEVVPQWGTFALFAVLLVAGLAAVAAMVRKVLVSPASGDEAA